MKKLTVVAAVASIMGFCAAPAIAAPTIWGNAYTDFLVNEDANKKESQIIGIEGGMITSGGTDLYGFYEHNPNLENDFAKVTIHSSLIGDFGVYGRVSAFKEGDFEEMRYIVGAGYQGFVGEDYAIKPYIGALRIDVNDDKGDEKVAFGYSGYKNLNPGVVLSSWVDAHFDDTKMKASGSVGIQKDLTIIKGTYVGAFYNMNYNELGVKGYSDSVQLRVGYHF